MMNSADILAAVRIRGRREPYYIYAPPYSSSSAGIRVLHLLAHLINLSGETAWLYIPDGDDGALAPHLAGRLLTPTVLATHQKEGRRPILVHPETLSPPLDMGALVVGYALNFPGHLTGPSSLNGSHYNIAYTEELAAATDDCRRVLYIPASDPEFFSPTTGSNLREGVAAYAGKYIDVHGGRLGRIPDLRETVRRSDQITPENLREILRRRRAIYIYENTAIATEALLCGCAVVRVANSHFDRIIGEEKLGNHGYVDITEADQTADHSQLISSALDQVSIFRENYLRTFQDVAPALDSFIAETQELARTCLAPRFSLPARDASSLENVTGKLHQWAISIDRLGWRRTINLGVRRKFQQVTNIVANNGCR